MRGWPAIVSAATVLYGCALIAFTLFPLPDLSPEYCRRHEYLTYWQLDPLNSLDDISAYALANSLVATLTSGVLLQALMSVVFFVPAGFLIAYRWHRSFGFAVLASFGLSMLIELTQGTGIWGLAECPYRLADVDDLLTNTIGGVVGWLIGRVARRHLPDPVPTPVDDLAPPGVLRRAMALVLDALIYILVMVAVLIPLEVQFGGPDRGTWGFVGVGLLVSLFLFVAVPVVRSRRSSPGAASVMLLPVDSNGGPPGLRVLLRMWAWRWLPVGVFGLVALPVVAAVEGFVAWRRGDDRSAVEAVAGVTVVTEQHHGREATPAR